MQLPGIEPGSPAWQASIIPLDHSCDAMICVRADRRPRPPRKLRPSFKCFHSSVSEHVPIPVRARQT
eukprot:scaffold69145_cov53-Phaeocystis_antarctica.AAC.5